MKADVLVTAEQMRAIEAGLFEAGMPIPALMEKVAGLITLWLIDHFPVQAYPRVGVLVGPGHNGGDALVVARELGFRGYQVQVCCPCQRQKPLTQDHLRFVTSLGWPVVPDLGAMQPVDVWVDGLFGFGLERRIEAEVAALIAAVNAQSQPVVSIDLPSGIHTDTGAVLGVAVQATHTLCLGLWKRAFGVDAALAYLGQSHLIDFHIPAAAIATGLGGLPPVRRLTQSTALERLPLPRSPATHKYRVGQLVILAGSRQYAGAALLAGLGARASGVGMLTLVVPESLRLTVVGQIPEALVVGCPETATGSMAHLPADLDLSRYHAIACGPGLTRSALPIVEAALASPSPLLVDADGLNLLAELNPREQLPNRPAPTLLTPHPGEFKRLFPALNLTPGEAGEAAQRAAQHSQSVIVLKGACTAIAHPDGRLWMNIASTSALARGGSGDVLTGLMGGLLAQAVAAAEAHSQAVTPDLALDAALAATWWHTQAAKQAATDHTELGVDGPRLASYLTPTLAKVWAGRQN
ncbi:MAG TPA: NAD(P)H-hydrate dehydratase [Leptolyngbyaceae cyanobacterium M65_K2018_010]|nr:NAD(P)H-hydrate dehydratase [Leptolyngbyaceae cyanobacterium M65_K2018_010]